MGKSGHSGTDDNGLLFGAWLEGEDVVVADVYGDFGVADNHVGLGFPDPLEEGVTGGFVPEIDIEGEVMHHGELLSLEVRVVVVCFVGGKGGGVDANLVLGALEVVDVRADLQIIGRFVVVVFV